MEIIDRICGAYAISYSGYSTIMYTGSVYARAENLAIQRRQCSIFIVGR